MPFLSLPLTFLEFEPVTRDIHSVYSNHKATAAPFFRVRVYQYGAGWNAGLATARTGVPIPGLEHGILRPPLCSK